MGVVEIALLPAVVMLVVRLITRRRKIWIPILVLMLAIAVTGRMDFLVVDVALVLAACLVGGHLNRSEA